MLRWVCALRLCIGVSTWAGVGGSEPLVVGKGRVDWFELMSRTGIGVANRFHSTRQGS